MDPGTIGVGLKVFGKLLSLGISAWHATNDHGVSLEKDIKAVQDLLGVGEQFAGLMPAGRSPGVQARYAALITSGFGEAWKVHFGPRRSLDNQNQVNRQIDAAIKWALLDRPSGSQSSTSLEDLTQLVRGPLQTGFYISLWDAFTKRNLPSMGDMRDKWIEPLIQPTSGDDRRRFEASFRLACAEALAGPTGQVLRAALAEAEFDRAEVILHLLVSDLSTWGKRHVFGNLRRHAILPDMPLDEMYVEPRAHESDLMSAPVAPIREQIRSLLAQHRIVVVAGDFGHGKSLTARMLARDLAREFLEEPEVPGGKLSVPVFVRCQDGVAGGSFELPRAVRLAQWKHLDSLRIAVKESDPALGLPPDGQRVVFILDGLDEVAFIERGILELFHHLRRQTSQTHKIVVFTRPQVLPRQELRHLEVPVLELLPFDDDKNQGGQIGDWLSRWNGRSGHPPIELADIQSNGLIDLARTPILLFMMAYVWPELSLSSWGAMDPSDSPFDAAWRSRQQLYETFFRAIARGKHQFDEEHHPQVVKAAEAIRDRLVALGFLRKSNLRPDNIGKANSREQIDRDLAIDAMLWAMARIAWEHRCLEQQGEELQLRHVENVLADELGIRETSTQKVVSDGLLLTMQADLTRGGQRILFGHKSFREFLVAACWLNHLERLISEERGSRRSDYDPEAVLLSGRLMEEDDNSWLFIKARLAAWDSEKRQLLHAWAQRYFNDESIISSSGRTKPTLNLDQRLFLREATLAIGSMISEAGGVRADHPRTLRSMLAGFWCQQLQPLIRAPGFQSAHADLSGANLVRAIFTGAQLGGADLSNADLASANLEKADLTGAKLVGADLQLSRLSEAMMQDAILSSARMTEVSLCKSNLTNAKLDKVDLTSADLDGAILVGATLLQARASSFLQAGSHITSFRDANLESADLREAQFSAARMSGAILEKACLSGANFRKADFSSARMAKADMRGAKLRGAHLAGADLSEADLRAADCTGACLRGADLQGATLTGIYILSGEPPRHPTDGLGANLTQCDLTAAVLTAADLSGADLRDANLQTANLTNANVDGARWTGDERTESSSRRPVHAMLMTVKMRRADLSGAILVGAKLAGADFRNARLPPMEPAVE